MPDTRAIVALLCHVIREQRAARVRPGTEQEIAWHALVPQPFHRQTPAPAPAARPNPPGATEKAHA